MKLLVVVMTAFLGMVASQSSNLAETYYQTEDDYVDMNNAIADIESLVDCFLNRAPCSPKALKFKNYMQEAIMTACANCNSEQLGLFGRFLGAVRARLPQINQNTPRYDPLNINLTSIEEGLSRMYD